MAAEIRDLEDQLYWYDHEYRLLEQQLETLRRRNAALQSNSSQANPGMLKPLPFGAGGSAQSQSSPSSESKSQNTPRSNAPPALESRQLPQQESQDRSSSDVQPGGSLESLPPPRQSVVPGGAAPQGQPATPTGPVQSDKPIDLEFNAGELIVPTITTGQTSPPSLDVAGRSETPDRDFELSLSQIEIPPQLTAGRNSTARITQAVQVVTDKRIVDLAFHPALSRAVSFDDDRVDDGLYLVLQPKNELGQVVAIPGAVQIEVFDSARPDDKQPIGS